MHLGLQNTQIHLDLGFHFSAVGGKNFPKVRVDNLNRSKVDNQQETYVQASKLYKLPNLGLRGILIGLAFEVDHVGSKPFASSPVCRPAT